MANNTLKEIRPVMVTESDFEIFDFKFRILCALKNQTVGERFASLMEFDLNENHESFSEDWIAQQDLIDLLERNGKTVSRQTLRNHRKSGNLPADLFVESKIEADQPNAAKNQRTYYKRDKCLEFYGVDPKGAKK